MISLVVFSTFLMLQQCACRGRSIRGGRFISIDEYEHTVHFFSSFFLTSFPIFLCVFVFVCRFAVFLI